MSSSDASFDSSSDFETAETEVEYDLEVEVMSDASQQKDTSDYDEPEDVYANESDRLLPILHFRYFGEDLGKTFLKLVHR